MEVEKTQKRQKLLGFLGLKHDTLLNFNYNSLWAPPIAALCSPTDIGDLYELATSIRYNAKIKQKYWEMDRIMSKAGFREFHAGTNRRIYAHLDYKHLMSKVALDDSGLKDSQPEYENQFIFAPYCSKIFEVTPNGSVSFVERFEPILNRETFLYYADAIFDILDRLIDGKYAVADIGTNYFMNWGVRPGFGPGLLDFPYAYALDGNKLYCKNILPDGTMCTGVIDHDPGYNEFICNHCGKVYQARDLELAKKENLIEFTGGLANMNLKMSVKIGKETIFDNRNDIPETESIETSGYGIGNIVQAAIAEAANDVVKEVQRVDSSTPSVKEVKESEKRDDTKDKIAVLMQQYKKDVSQYSETLSKREVEISELKRKIDSYKANSDSLQELNNRLKMQLNDKDKVIDELLEKIDELTELHTEYEHDEHDYQTRINHLESVIKDKDEIINSADTDKKVFSEDIEKLKAEHDRAEYDLNQKIDNLSNDLLGKDTTIKELNEKLMVAQNSIQCLEHERDALMEALEAHDAEKQSSDGIKSSIESLENRIISQEETIASLKNELGTAKALRDQIYNVNKEIELMNTNLVHTLMLYKEKEEENETGVSEAVSETADDVSVKRELSMEEVKEIVDSRNQEKKYSHLTSEDIASISSNANKPNDPTNRALDRLENFEASGGVLPEAESMLKTLANQEETNPASDNGDNKPNIGPLEKLGITSNENYPKEDEETETKPKSIDLSNNNQQKKQPIGNVVKTNVVEDSLALGGNKYAGKNNKKGKGKHNKGKGKGNGSFAGY